MANGNASSIKGKLLIFLLGVACLVTTSLYFDLLSKNALLLERVEQLEESQVLLMVPDDQAQAIATWLAEHPEQTQSLLKNAKAREQVSISMGPDVPVEQQLKVESTTPPLLIDNSNNEPLDKKEDSHLSGQKAKRDAAPKLTPQVVAEGKDGVKVIKLPHGGIRVTTREDK